MAINNKILLYHLKEHFGSSVPIDLLPFIEKLNDVYNQNDSVAGIDTGKSELVKVKNKAKPADDCGQLKIHNALIQQAAKTGSWEFDYPAHNLSTHTKAADAHVSYFSEEIYKILGLEPGSADINKELFFPQLNPYDLNLILQGNTGNKVNQYQEEHTLRMEDGSEKVVLKKSDIFFDKAHGAPTRIVGTLQDITEKKILENDLQKTREKKYAILQNLFNAYLSYDVINNKVLFSNIAFQKVFEDTPLQNKTSEASFLSLISEEDKTGAYTLLRKLAKGETATYNFRILLNNGGFRWLESRLVPTLGPDGRLMQIELIANDITAYKQADKRISDVRNDFQKQLFNVGEVVMLLNDKLQLTYVSENVTRLLGYLPAEIVGVPLQRFLHHEELATVVDFYKKIEPGITTESRISFRLRHKFNDDVWCECAANNMTANPLIGSIINRVRDITFFKEHETKLVAEVNELKKINTNLEDFVSVVSHDLRAPLASMQGILGLMDLKEGSTLFSEELAFLRGSITKLDSFIIDLLNYSKCTKTELKPESICLEELLDETTAYLQFMNAQNTRVQLRKNVKNGVLFYSDPKMINIILNNLITNAVRYSNPHTAAPFVEVKINANDVNASIEVTDNGIGIAKEDQQKVFDMFYRVTEDNVGTGMGLHLVKLAVEKLSGKISLESENNVGTKFSIVIPNMLNNNN